MPFKNLYTWQIGKLNCHWRHKKIDGDFETFEYAKINMKCFLLNDAKHYKLQINTCDVLFNRIEYLK